ncbi:MULTISPECIES: LGFP repeat-containing protein [unclassified Rhodococcus (in: high G+C Gram-positive bacteria)]|nr:MULTISPECIES: esterase [unclassified Rhodococcus (in: high G+C Gram-positive bacteria)]MBF0660674.1 esterase [Rhodococcus sp. (in: high G+C Gram-positive bacteria)]NMD96261.1 esterase [Rhodococcus sp. BL-253-APC-6A1W]NME79993.1 esterase [Rhodococcus sp. 105337]
MRIPRRSASIAAAVAAVGLVAVGCGDDNSASDVVGSATSAVGSAAESVGSQAQSAVESITAGEDAESTGSGEPSEPAADQSSAVPGPNGEEVELSGPILAKYMEVGGAESPLGNATGNQEEVGDGYVAEFDGGIIAWSPDTDAHIVWGEIRVAWEADGGAGGVLGFPISDEEVVPGGFRSNFQFGYITYIDGATEVVQE